MERHRDDINRSVLSDWNGRIWNQISDSYVQETGEAYLMHVHASTN